MELLFYFVGIGLLFYFGVCSIVTYYENKRIIKWSKTGLLKGLEYNDMVKCSKFLDKTIIIIKRNDYSKSVNSCLLPLIRRIYDEDNKHHVDVNKAARVLQKCFDITPNTAVTNFDYEVEIIVSAFNNYFGKLKND